MANDRPVSMKTKQYRKVVKPLLERRRRARINGCLNELRHFILEATKQDSVQASKLEKADILEMTVHYLRLLLRQQRCSPSSTTTTSTATDVGRFRAGFTECAHEVSLFVAANMSSAVNPQVRNRLLGHLSKCLSHLEHPVRPEVTSQGTVGTPPYSSPVGTEPDECPPPFYRTTTTTTTTTPWTTPYRDSQQSKLIRTSSAVSDDAFQRPSSSSSSFGPRHQDRDHYRDSLSPSNGTIVMTMMHRDQLIGSPVWRPW